MPLIVNVMGFTREEVATLVDGVRRARRGRRARAQRLLPERRDRADHGRRPGRDRARCSSACARCTDKPLIVKLTPNARRPGGRRRGRRGGRRRRRLADQHAARHGARTRATGRAVARRRHRRRLRARRSARSRSRRSREVARARRDPDRRDGRGPDAAATRATCCAAGADLRRGRHRELPRPARRRPDRGRAGGDRQRTAGSSVPARVERSRARAMNASQKPCKALDIRVNSASTRLNLRLRSRRIRRITRLPTAAVSDVDSPPMPPATKTPTKPIRGCPRAFARSSGWTRSSARTRSAPGAPSSSATSRPAGVSIHDLLLEPPEYVETAKVFDMLLAVPEVRAREGQQGPRAVPHLAEQDDRRALASASAPSSSRMLRR